MKFAKKPHLISYLKLSFSLQHQSHSMTTTYSIIIDYRNASLSTNTTFWSLKIIGKKHIFSLSREQRQKKRLRTVFYHIKNQSHMQDANTSIQKKWMLHK